MTGMSRAEYASAIEYGGLDQPVTHSRRCVQRHEYDFLVVGSSIERTYWHDLLQFAEVGLAAHRIPLAML